MERFVEGKDDFLLEGSPYGRYYTGLRWLRVPHPDAQRAASELANEEDLQRAIKIANTVFTVGYCRYLELCLIGQNPYVGALKNYLFSQFSQKIANSIWDLGKEVVKEGNQFLNPEIPFLTLPDLIHPLIPPAVESYRRVSTWGGHKISERLSKLTGKPIPNPTLSLGRGLDCAIGEILRGVSFKEAFDHLVEPLLFFGELVERNWYLFLREVLLPTREEVVEKFFRRR